MIKEEEAHSAESAVDSPAAISAEKKIPSKPVGSNCIKIVGPTISGFIDATVAESSIAFAAIPGRISIIAIGIAISPAIKIPHLATFTVLAPKPLCITN